MIVALSDTITNESCPQCQTPATCQHGRSGKMVDGAFVDTGCNIHLWKCEFCGESQALVAYDCEFCEETE